MTLRTDVAARLADAYRIEVTDRARSQHHAAIATAVKERSPLPIAGPSRLRRRLAVAMAALVALALPMGTAVAAEDALPGDLLYPVKQATERVRAVFDDDVAATHRVEELETMIDVEPDVSRLEEAAARAEAAVGRLETPGSLAPRLEQAQEQVRNRHRNAAEPGRPGPLPPSPGSDAGLAPVIEAPPPAAPDLPAERSSPDPKRGGAAGDPPDSPGNGTGAGGQNGISGGDNGDGSAAGRSP